MAIHIDLHVGQSSICVFLCWLLILVPRYGFTIRWQLHLLLDFLSVLNSEELPLFLPNLRKS